MKGARHYGEGWLVGVALLTLSGGPSVSSVQPTGKPMSFSSQAGLIRPPALRANVSRLGLPLPLYASRPSRGLPFWPLP